MGPSDTILLNLVTSSAARTPSGYFLLPRAASTTVYTQYANFWPQQKSHTRKNPENSMWNLLQWGQPIRETINPSSPQIWYFHGRSLLAMAIFLMDWVPGMLSHNFIWVCKTITQLMAVQKHKVKGMECQALQYLQLFPKRACFLIFLQGTKPNLFF